MGLDMMAFTLDRRPASPVDFDLPADCEGQELHCWRKHPDLHGWMEQLYFSKGGKGRDGMDGPATFNWLPVLLDAADLDALEAAIKARALPHTEGFFFGQSQYPDDDIDTLDFIAKAREAIADGKTVYYTSWW